MIVRRSKSKTQRKFSKKSEKFLKFCCYLRRYVIRGSKGNRTLGTRFYLENSPSVAPFFAFRSVPNPLSDRVAIDVHQVRTGELQAVSVYGPLVWQIGPSIPTHRRHFLQQSRYTVCTRQRIESPRELEYASHEDAFAIDLHIRSEIHKITLPAGQRKEARKYFGLHNFTAYSLFGRDNPGDIGETNRQDSRQCRQSVATGILVAAASPQQGSMRCRPVAARRVGAQCQRSGSWAKTPQRENGRYLAERGLDCLPTGWRFELTENSIPRQHLPAGSTNLE